MAHGNTRAKAIANAEEAVTVWIETAKADGIKSPVTARTLARRMMISDLAPFKPRPSVPSRKHSELLRI